MASGNPFDQFAGVFDSTFPPSTPREEKGVTWEAKVVGGKLYVPIEQVLELLQGNNALPKMQERLKTHIENQAARTRLDI